MLTKELHGLVLPETTFGDAHHKGLVVLFGSVQVNAVQCQEDERGNGPHTFVPIDEWVISDDVKEICGRHREKIFVEVVITGTGRWHGECRPQESEVPDSLGAAVAVYLVAMNQHDLAEFQEEWLHYLLPKTPQGATVAEIRLFQSRMKLLRALHVADRRDNQRLAIGRNLEGSLGVNLEQIENTPIQHQREAVSMPRQRLHQRHFQDLR
jgi:hypothetical protein